MNFRIFPIILALPLLAQAQPRDTAALRMEIEAWIEQAGEWTVQQQLDSALHVIRKAETTCLSAFGAQTELYALVLDMLGTIHYYRGQFDLVESIWLQASRTWEATVGTDNADYAVGLNNLGTIYCELGKYELAEPLFVQCLDIQRRIHGPDHPDIVMGMNNLAVLYYRMGQLDQSERIFLQALAKSEALLGKDDPTYASNVNNLAMLYKRMGNYPKAEKLYLEVVDIRAGALGTDHPHYAQSVNNLANLYLSKREFGKARPLFEQALTIWEKSVGVEHPDYSWGLINLGTVHQEEKNFEEAKSCFTRALAGWQKSVGKSHPNYFTGLNNLALLHFLMGEYDASEQLYLEALQTGALSMGMENASYAGTLLNLAMLYAETGRLPQAQEWARRYDDLDKQLLSNATRHLAEEELSLFIRRFEMGQGKLMGIAGRGGQMADRAYDNALFYKGYLLEARQQVNRLAMANAESRALFFRLKGMHRLLADQYAKPPDRRDGWEDLQEQAIALEKELTRTVAGYQDAHRPWHWQDVQAALHPGEVAIEIVRYPEVTVEPSGKILYDALLVHNQGPPRQIPLFEESMVRSRLGKRAERRMTYVNSIYDYQDRGLQPLGESLPSLYELVWKPMEDSLAGIHTIYYAPAGLLHRLNVDALAMDEDRVVADQFRIIPLGSTRQLVLPDDREVVANEAWLFGGIRFDRPQNDAVAPGDPEPSSDIATRSSSREEPGEWDVRGSGWGYLKWTKREVEALDGVIRNAGLESRLFMEELATEEQFKTMGTNRPSPYILHLATHGFFHDGQPMDSTGSFEPEAALPFFLTSANPMMRSGLILAGGNEAWRPTPHENGKEDGILTAYEISQMDLSNTELVVLSACETGLGDIEGNEGVYGLQRAFRIAGVRTLLMSLWEVPDVQTQELMTHFYRLWLEEKIPIADAFHQAQKALRKKYIHPWFWAGFVLLE